MFSGGPAITLFLRGRNLDASALTIALALTPIIIAIAASALGTESSEGIAGRIWPGLAAIAGLLLVLVQPTLGDLRTDLALAFAPMLTGIGAVLFCADQSPDQPHAASRMPTALLGASTLFAIALAASYFAAHARPSLALPAVACDGILALLSMLTLNQLGATRWSSQFTWIPLLVILEGIVLVRPRLTAHWFIGLHPADRRRRLSAGAAGRRGGLRNLRRPHPPRLTALANPPRFPLAKLQSTTLAALHSSPWQPRCTSWSRARTPATTST